MKTKQITPYFYTFLAFLAMSLTFTSHAYIGPGMGLGALGVVIGVVFSVFLAIVAIFWYPFKRLIKRFSKSKEAEAEIVDSSVQQTTDETEASDKTQS